MGGPIERDKLLFFDYLGSRYRKGGLGSASVITGAMRNGDFSALLAASSPIQLYDSENNFAPYAGNQGVPILNPVANYLIANPQYYPLPPDRQPELDPVGGAASAVLGSAHILMRGRPRHRHAALARWACYSRISHKTKRFHEESGFLRYNGIRSLC